MYTGVIPVRYARALLEFALEKSKSDRVYAEMGMLAGSFSREPGLRQALDNPVLPPAEKEKLVLSAAGGDVSDVLRRFVALVTANRRERYLQSISLMYLDLYRKRNNISTGRLETAVPVSAETEERLRARIASETRGQVELTTQVRPELIGGFVFEMDFERVDASVASQLRSIKRQFIEKNRRIV